MKLNERSWVHALAARVEKELQGVQPRRIAVKVSDGRKLAYACAVHEYDSEGGNSRRHGLQCVLTVARAPGAGSRA